MIIIRYIIKAIKALHKDTDPTPMAVAFAMGMVMGLTPFGGLYSWILIALALILRVNIAVFGLSWGVFAGVSYLVNPAFDSIGTSLLSASALQGLWTSFYNSPFWRSLEFNNTIVLGSLLCSLVLFVPVCLLIRFLIVQYRERVMKYVLKSRLGMALKGTSFFRFYGSVD